MLSVYTRMYKQYKWRLPYPRAAESAMASQPLLFSSSLLLLLQNRYLIFEQRFLDFCTNLFFGKLTLAGEIYYDIKSASGGACLPASACFAPQLWLIFCLPTLAYIETDKNSSTFPQLHLLLHKCQHFLPAANTENVRQMHLVIRQSSLSGNNF